MKKRSIKIKFAMLILPVSILALILAFVFSLYKKDSLVNQEITNAQKSLVFNLDQKLDKKFDVGLTNAVALTTNLDLRKALKSENREDAVKILKSIGNEYKNNTNFKGIRVHIHDKNLKSFLRSWSVDKYGDDLSIRGTLKEVQEKKNLMYFLNLVKVDFLLEGWFQLLKMENF